MSVVDAAPALPPLRRKGSVLQRVRNVVASELRPLAARIDAEGLYPSHILKQLGAAGAFAQHHEGIGEEEAIDLGLAIQSMSVISEACLSTAFCTWCQDAFGWYLQNSENSELRARFQGAAASGAIFGGTGLSNPMKALSGIEQIKLKGVRAPGGYRVDGVLPWVSNLAEGHCFAFCFEAEGETLAAIGRLGFDGVESRKGAEFIALEGTATVAVGFKNATIPDEMILSDRFARFAGRIKPGFLLLQTGMATGLVRNCAQLMREMPARVRAVNAYLPIGPEALEERLTALECEIMALAATPFESDCTYLRSVLLARLEGSRLALDAAQSLMLYAGASAYLRNSVYNRRLRESYFVAIVTPAIKHLMKELAPISTTNS
jgi:alkylation response protein AidB-like acyl-CoA dehydrogenase